MCWELWSPSRLFMKLWFMGNTCFTSGGQEPHNYSWLHRQNAYMLLRFCTLSLQRGFQGRNRAMCHVGLLSTPTQGRELCATLSLPAPMSLTPGNVWKGPFRKLDFLYENLTAVFPDVCLFLWAQSIWVPWVHLTSHERINLWDPQRTLGVTHRAVSQLECELPKEGI